MMTTALSQPYLSAGKGVCGVSAGNICSYKSHRPVANLCPSAVEKNNVLARMEVYAFLNTIKEEG